MIIWAKLDSSIFSLSYSKLAKIIFEGAIWPWPENTRCWCELVYWCRLAAASLMSSPTGTFFSTNVLSYRYKKFIVRPMFMSSIKCQHTGKKPPPVSTIRWFINEHVQYHILTDTYPHSHMDGPDSTIWTYDPKHSLRKKTLHVNGLTL